ncbi:MAG: hypothetical protein V9F04_01165 [Dermatophilaceae bacterium]
MTGPALTYVGGFTIAFLGGCAALAQQLPPPESGEKTMNVRMVNGQVEMRDARDDTPIMLPKGVPLHQPKPNSNLGDAAWSSSQEQPNGFDLTYTLRQPVAAGAGARVACGWACSRSGRRSTSTTSV